LYVGYGGAVFSLCSPTQITVFDHRGCPEHINREYTGPKAGNDNDEMALKVRTRGLKLISNTWVPPRQ
jgi:hypothetical protein